MAWRLLLAIFGIVIVASPHIGYATLALITGIGFICYGLGMLALGWAMHVVRRGEPVPVSDASRYDLTAAGGWNDQPA